MELILKARDLKGGYTLQSPLQRSAQASQEYIDAVSNVSMELYRDEVFGIAGESGCGKSTLIKILYGYINPPLTLKQGSVELYAEEEKPIDISSLGLEERQRRVWWKRISYIPQASMNILNPTMRIRDHFAEMFKIHMGMGKEKAYPKAQEYAESMGLPRDALRAFPHQLSGGMRQRTVIAMAVLLKPELVLADEPSSALDVITQRTALTFLKDVQRGLGNTLVLVTHDMGIQAVLTDRVAIMYAGKIIEIGETAGIFEKPLHPYTQALIDSLPRLGDKSQRTGLGGQPPDLSRPPAGCRFHPRCAHAMDACNREEPQLLEKGDGRHVACWLYA